KHIDWMFARPRCSVIVKINRYIGVTSAIQPHVRFISRRSSFFTQNLKSRLICVQDVVFNQFGVQAVIQIDEPVIRSANHPVGHRLARQLKAKMLELLFLAVKWNGKGIFSIHDKSQESWRDMAAWKHRSWHRSGDYWCGHIMFFSVAASIHVAYVFHHFNLRWDHFTFLANFFAHLM